MSVNPDVLTDMLAVWDEYGDPLRVALLALAPASTNGVWASDLSTYELSESSGYTRAELPLSALGEVFQLRRRNLFRLAFGANTSTDRLGVTHVALLSEDASLVLSIVQLASPIIVDPGRSFLIRPTDLGLDVS